MTTHISLAQNWASQPEYSQVDWLIQCFNHLFSTSNTILVRGNDEPEYIPASWQQPARIIFAHGYYASALHEIAHWCLAGKRRRQLYDYGYWYCPEGRNAEQQAKFEQVEIKPQAIECLFTLASGKRFVVSLDNFGLKNYVSHFESDVYQQVLRYFYLIDTLPTDAYRLYYQLRLANLRPESITTHTIDQNFATNLSKIG